MPIPSTLAHADGTPCAGRLCAWLLDSAHAFNRPTVLRTDAAMTSGGGYRTMIVTQNEPGYDEGPLLAVDSYAEAAATVDRYNTAHGYTPEQAMDVVASSMFAR